MEPNGSRAQASYDSRALLGSKGITLLHIPTRETLLKPLHPLLGGAVGEGLRYYRTPDTALQVIIPNLRCSLEGSRDILSIDDPPFGRVMSPHPGKTVSLQLDPNGELIGRCLIHPGLYVPNFIKGTKEVLHVMADFMCDSIGASKVSLWPSRSLYSLEKVHV